MLEQSPLAVDETSRGVSRRMVVKTAAWSVPTVAVAVGIPQAAHASPGDGVVLFTSAFDGIGSGLPSNFSVRTGATTSAVGTAAAFATAAAPWNNTGGGFKNVASADGLTAASDTTAQNASTDRAVAVRQVTATDTGVAFTIDSLSTADVTGVTVSFKAQSLDASSPRQTTWTVDAFVGATRITSGTTFTTGNSTFGSTSVAAIFPATIENQTGVTIRIACLTATTGTGNRATTGIDDLTVSATSTV